MKYVLDSSVAFKWVVPESDTPRAVQLRDEFRAAVHELIAPDVFPPELAHALTRAERQGRINDAVTRLIDVLTTSPILIPSLPLLLRAADISSTLRVGVYDCLYVALAEREGASWSQPTPGSWRTSSRRSRSSSTWRRCHDLCPLVAISASGFAGAARMFSSALSLMDAWWGLLRRDLRQLRQC